MREWTPRVVALGLAVGLAMTGTIDVLGLYVMGAALGAVAGARALYASVVDRAAAEAMRRNGGRHLVVRAATRRQLVALAIQLGFLVAGVAGFVARAGLPVPPAVDLPTVARVATDLLQIAIVGGVWGLALNADMDHAAKQRLVRYLARSERSGEIPVGGKGES